MTDPTHDTLVSRAEWDTAFTLCDNENWDLSLTVDADENPDQVALTSALMAAYNTEADDRSQFDPDTVRACILAAQDRYGQEWTVSQFDEVVESFSIAYDGGWAELAQNYLDDHFPGLPPTWLIDLTTIGKEVQRPSEQYITLDADETLLYIFNRPA